MTQKLAENANQNSPEPRVVVAMLGPRMHYAVPRLLAREGLLQHFFTDSYAGNKASILRLMNIVPMRLLPGAARRWMGRVCSDISPHQITSFEFLGLTYAFGRGKARSSTELTTLYAKINKRFCQKIARHDLGSASLVWGFNSASVELFSAARKQGLRCILEQTILPRSEEDKLMAEECARWPELCNEQHPSKENPLARRESVEWELADHIVVGSEFVAEGLKRCGVSSDKISVIPYGVGAEWFAVPERSAPLPSHKLKVLFAGEVGLRKGIPDLLHALRKLGPNRVEARIAGRISLPEDWLSGFRDVATFLGTVPRREMSKLYAWADVFVLPSIVEGSATVTYEALLAGLPIIVTPNTGSIIEDNKSGQIVPIRSPDKISVALARYLDEPGLWEHHAEGARGLRDMVGLERYQREIVELCRVVHSGASLAKVHLDE